MQTFSGESCSPSNLNDFVDDTGQQADATSSIRGNDIICPVGQNSCPDLPLFDPVTNFMDYSSCRSEFTPGQIERMYAGFNEYRRRLEPCEDSRLRIEVQYDGQPEDLTIGYRPLGKKAYTTRVQLQISSEETHVQLANQLVFRELCVERNDLHELFVIDRTGLSDVSFTMNGREVVRTSDFESGGSLRIFVAGDSATCESPNVRFSLDLSFSTQAPADVSWKICDSVDRVVVDSTATTARRSDTYSSTIFAGKTLYFDHCLSPGDYFFQIMVSSSDSVSDRIDDVRLALDDEVIYQGNKEDTISFNVSPPPGCFSGTSTVELLNRGRTEIASLQIGDMVHVGHDVYEPVYSFGHYGPSSKGHFVEIKTDTSTFQVTKEHLLFNALYETIPVSLVTEGTGLLNATGFMVAVKSVKEVSSKGVFAPFTPSGQIVVDGILASSFIALDESSSLRIMGLDISHHWLAHSFEFPHRLACHYLGTCHDEIYNEKGVLKWLATSHRLGVWALDCNFGVRSVILLLLMLVFVLFNIVEWFLLNPRVTLVLLCCFSYRFLGGKQQDLRFTSCIIDGSR